MKRSLCVQMPFVACVEVMMMALTGCASSDVSLYAGSTIMPLQPTQSASAALQQKNSSKTQTNAAPLAPRKVISLERLGLASAVGLALAQHPDIGRAGAAISQSRAEVTVAEAAWYPKLAYVSNISGLKQASPSASLAAGTHTAGLDATQLLYDFGRAQSTLAAAEATTRQRDAELNDTRERVALTTSEAHLEAARGNRLAVAADYYQVSLRRLHEAIKLRAASGAADQADVYFADVRLQGAAGEKVRTETRRETAQSKLYRIIGVRPHSVGDPGRIVAALAESMAGRYPDGATGVAAAEQAAIAARARVAGAEASLYPAISLHGTQSYALADPVHNVASVLGVSIQGDFFNGGATQGRILAAKQEAVAAEKAIALARLTTNVEVDSANAEISGARQRRAIFLRQAELAIQSRDIYLAEYQIGKRSLTDVLNAEQEIYKAETEQINADADVWSSVVRAAAARGELVRFLEGAARH